MREIIYLLLLIVNLVTLFLMGIDKWNAMKEKSRIPESRLLTLGLFTGGIGGLLGMYLFRHKIRKPQFKAVFVLGSVLLGYILTKVR